MLISHILKILRIKLKIQNSNPPITGDGIHILVNNLLLFFIILPNKKSNIDKIRVGIRSSDIDNKINHLINIDVNSKLY